MKQIDIVLVGIGGYGKKYANTLLGEGKRPEYEPYRVVGAVQRNPVRFKDDPLFKDIPLYATLEEFYATNKADLAIISTPIPLHREHIETCVGNGSNVLCEKPLCSSVEDAVAIQRLAEESDLKIFIGYQQSFARGFKQLKEDILSGMFGKPLSFKTLICYPRSEKYYARNQWAGKIASDDGQLILDSPLHNAVAHHLNNMLFLLGDAPDTAASLKTLQAELYRANPTIDNYDTVSLRAKTESDVDFMFFTSHAIRDGDNIGPYNVFKFENAVLFHDDKSNFEAFFAIFNDGRVRRYEPFSGTDNSAVVQLQKTWDCIDDLRGGEKINSTVKASVPEVICVNATYLCRDIKQIDEKYVKYVGTPGERFATVEGLEDGLMRCFDEGKLFSEIGGIPWAEPTEEIEVARVFEEGFSPIKK